MEEEKLGKQFLPEVSSHCNIGEITPVLQCVFHITRNLTPMLQCVFHIACNVTPMTME